MHPRLSRGGLHACHAKEHDECVRPAQLWTWDLVHDVALRYFNVCYQSHAGGYPALEKRSSLQMFVLLREAAATPGVQARPRCTVSPSAKESLKLAEAMPATPEFTALDGST